MSPRVGPRVEREMGLIIAIIALVIVVPLVFLLLSRRSTSAGGTAVAHRDRGVTVAEPSSDQPSPDARNTNRARPAAETRLPPG